MLSDLSQEDFLAHYWQQQPLVVRRAFANAEGIIDGDELAGLAFEESVESRIISGSGISGPWVCRQGPFVDFDYSSLGSTDWTLLVQGVDQWDDDVRELLDSFDFLPKWRLEDVMASFAPTGGGVGPHFDYYDVFLIQAAGRRRWQIGQRCDDSSALQDNSQVRLLQSFDRSASHDLEAGDAIYVPAGVAHWGTSLSDDCVTLSIGFRAPSDKELVAEAIDLLVPKLSDAMRFQDTSRSIDQDRYKINRAAAEYAQAAFERLDETALKAALEEAFGRLVTDTRYCSFSQNTQVWTKGSVAALIGNAKTVELEHQPHCRMAYSDTQLFVNGVAYEVETGFAKGLCHGLVKAPITSPQLEVIAVMLNDDMIVLS